MATGTVSSSGGRRSRTDRNHLCPTPFPRLCCSWEALLGASRALGTDPGNQQNAGTPGLCGPGKELPTTLSARKTRRHVLSGAPVWRPCRLSADVVKPQWRCQPFQQPDSLVTVPPWGPPTTDLPSEPGAGYSCSRLLEISIRITSLLPARGRGRARPRVSEALTSLTRTVNSSAFHLDRCQQEEKINL